MNELSLALDEMVNHGIELAKQKGMNAKLLSRQKPKVVKISGVSSISHGYIRSLGDKPPVQVFQYFVMLDDELLMIDCSYRVSEFELWASDLEKILSLINLK